MKNPRAFGDKLSRAVYVIVGNESKNIGIVQDELGFAIGRESGGSAIEYWRKGYVPSKKHELEQLACELVRRKGITTRTELDDFLRYADYLDRGSLCDRLFPPQQLQHLPDRSNARLTIMLEGTIETFTPEKRHDLVTTIAQTLSLHPMQIQIAQVIPGSIRVVLLLPTEAAHQAIDLYHAGHPAFQRFPILTMELEHEPEPQQPSSLAATVIQRLSDSENLKRLGLLPDDTVPSRLWERLLGGLKHYADPLLPTTRLPDPDDAVERAALLAYLEGTLATDSTFAQALEAIVNEPFWQWSEQQRVAAMIARAARTTATAFGYDPNLLTPALQNALHHQDEDTLNQTDIGHRRWRLPFRAWLTAANDDVWHVRLAQVVVVLFLRLESNTRQDILEKPSGQRFWQQVREVAQRARVPDRDHPGLEQAWREALQQIVQQDEQAAVLASSPHPARLRKTRQEDAVALTVWEDLLRGFALRVPTPLALATPILSEQNTLFTDNLPEVRGNPVVSVSRSGKDQGTPRLLVAIGEVPVRATWLVQLLVNDQVVAVARTDEAGVAEFTHLPPDVWQHQQFTLICRELADDQHCHKEEK